MDPIKETADFIWSNFQSLDIEYIEAIYSIGTDEILVAISSGEAETILVEVGKIVERIRVICLTNPKIRLLSSDTECNLVYIEDKMNLVSTISCKRVFDRFRVYTNHRLPSSEVSVFILPMPM